MSCVIQDCDRPQLVREMCSAHYARWYRGGTLSPAVRRHTTGLSVMARFMLKVVENDDGCWLWTGATSGTDRKYGRYCPEPTASTKLEMAHRVSYELFVGPIPEGLTIDHLCRVTLCVNPEHLEPVPLQENLRRRDEAARTRKVSS